MTLQFHAKIVLLFRVLILARTLNRKSKLGAWRIFPYHAAMGLVNDKGWKSPNPGVRGNANQAKTRRIPSEFISNVLARNDVVAVVGARVSGMKKKGSTYSACCPFHNEKSPSFTVSATRQTYHCFGCGVHGNALDFIIKHDGAPFMEALGELAQTAGMSLPDQDDSVADQAYMDRAQEDACYERNDTAVKFYRFCLAHSDEAKHYLIERGITAETARTFMIGYAPNEWRGLSEAFSTYNTDEILPAIGLVVVKEETKNRYDRFRNRLIFPVRDVRGRVIAFGGRTMPGEKADNAKYINSPESRLFNKTRTLFGLYEAQEGIREHKSAVIMEGYTDVVISHQFGVNNAVASMGTACTDEHMKRLKQMGAKTICFCFDGDSAGKNAAWKALRNCLPLIEDDVFFTFAFMPDGKDPDEVVKEVGSTRFFEMLGQAQQLIEYMLGELKAKHNNLLTSDDRGNFLNDAEALVRIMPFKSRFRDAAKQKMSEMTGIRLVSVRQQSRVVPPTFRKSPTKSIWARLHKAVLHAPNLTVEYRDALLEMLNTEDEDQAELIDAIRSARTQTEEDDAIFAEDIRSADVLIEAHLVRLQRAELQAQLAAGTIAGNEYVEKLQLISNAA